MGRGKSNSPATRGGMMFKPQRSQTRLSAKETVRLAVQNQQCDLFLAESRKLITANLNEFYAALTGIPFSPADTEMFAALEQLAAEIMVDHIDRTEATLIAASTDLAVKIGIPESDFHGYLLDWVHCSHAVDFITSQKQFDSETRAFTCYVTNNKNFSSVLQARLFDAVCDSVTEHSTRVLPRLGFQPAELKERDVSWITEALMKAAHRRTSFAKFHEICNTYLFKQTNLQPL
jgi:hypothetical protein